MLSHCCCRGSLARWGSGARCAGINPLCLQFCVQCHVVHRRCRHRGQACMAALTHHHAVLLVTNKSSPKYMRTLHRGRVHQASCACGLDALAIAHDRQMPNEAHFSSACGPAQPLGPSQHPPAPRLPARRRPAQRPGRSGPRRLRGRRLRRPQPALPAGVPAAAACAAAPSPARPAHCNTASFAASA